MDVRKDMNMRRKHWREFSIACGFILVTFLCVPGLAIADNRGDVNFIFGTKLLDDGEWGSLDEQDAFGVEVSWGQDSWPFLIAIDLLTSNDDQNILGAKWEGTTREIDVGVRKIWEKGRVRPYIGGGFAFISGEVERTGVGSDDDSAFGGWIGGGVLWRFGSRFNLGFSVRVSRAEPEIAGVDFESGGEFAGLALGWSWPGSS
jgi:hypothetical protein